MTRHHVPVPHVPQLRLGRRVGADGGATLVFVQRAARGEAAAAGRVLEVEHAPGAALALDRHVVHSPVHLGSLLVRERRPQDARVGMARLVRDVLRQTHLDDASEIHDRYFLTDQLHDREIVRDEQIREPQVFLQVAQQVHHLRLDRDVEGARRLVGHDEARAHCEHARDSDAALLAARELRGEVRELAVLETYLLQQLADAACDFGLARALVHGERLAQDVAHAHLRVEPRVEVLEDHLHLAP